MNARIKITLAGVLCGLAACGGEEGAPAAAAPDPIVGVWDDPATTSSAKFLEGGRIVDLGAPDTSNSWRRLEDGSYELELGRPDSDGPPFVTTARLEDDLLHLDTAATVTFRRRTWTPERDVGLEGKLIRLMTRPSDGSRISISGHYLDLDDGESAELRFRGGWVLVRFDGTRMSSARGSVPMQLGRRYRARGPVSTFSEFTQELERLGHEEVTFRLPQNCTRMVEVHELVELEEIDPLVPAREGEEPAPDPTEPD